MFWDKKHETIYNKVELDHKDIHEAIIEYLNKRDIPVTNNSDLRFKTELIGIQLKYATITWDEKK